MHGTRGHQQGGSVSLFDLTARGSTPAGGKEQESGPPSSPMSTPRTMPSLRYDAHGGTFSRLGALRFPDFPHSRHWTDAVGSVAFHPLRPLLLSVSGSRHFDHADAASGVSSGSSTSDSEGAVDEHTEGPLSSGSHAVKRRRNKPQPLALDTTIKLWDFGQGTTSGGQERGK